MAWNEGEGDAAAAWVSTDIKTRLYSNGDPDLREAVEALLRDDDIELTAHYAAFDLNVLCEAFPDLIPLIIAKLEAGKIHCTKIREKLLCISTHGRLQDIEMPDGSKMRLGFSLKDLVKSRLGDDRSEVKEAEDAWRLNYHLLDGKPSSEYPTDARDYAIQDSIDALLVYQSQEESKENEEGPSSIVNEFLHVAADFALYRMSVRGIAIDEEARSKIEQELATYLSDEKMQPLVDAGILRPAEAPREYKNRPGHFTEGKPASVDTKKLGALVQEVSERIGRPLKETKTGRVSTDDETMTELAEFDPTLKLYHERQALQRLVTTELPRIQAARVHPSYDALKETLRTSSYDGKLYPSLNIQNADPRVRPCFVPSPGNLLLSVDYSGIELACLAQKVYDLGFGSTLKDQINSGIDPHAFLGAQIACALDPGFNEACAIADGDTTAIYKAFLKLKAEQPDFFKHYRTFAKPTGLGYPGGLGPRTFMGFAKATYGITVDLETATVLRDLWHSTYPEMRQYFEWITFQCKDPVQPQIRSGGEFVDGFAYFSPLGSYRAGCTYCACANGAALQTPAAEGAKIALFQLEAAFVRGELLGAVPLAFIHDEVLFEVPEANVTGAAALCERIMIQSMQMVLPDVSVRCESKCSKRWYKEAQPIKVNGGLVPWEPKEVERAPALVA